MVMGPDLDSDRQPGHKKSWDWNPAWARRFGLVQLRVRNEYRVTVERPGAVSPVRRLYGVLFRDDGKAVLSGPAATAAPELGLVQADVGDSQEPEASLRAAAMQQTGAELGQCWLMGNLLYTPLDGERSPFYESIYVAEVATLAETMADQQFTRRSVLVRDLLSAVRQRHYEIAEALLLAIDRYVQWRAVKAAHEKEEQAEVTGG